MEPLRPLDESQQALFDLGVALRHERYEFITVTPETHRAANARAARRDDAARSLRDIFGWNLTFAPASLPSPFLELLRRADACVVEGDLLRSGVRFASLGNQLFVHSGYPTTGTAAVFFGPDSYRFAALLARVAPKARRAVDVGCGAGPGGLALVGRAQRIVLSDINERALSMARVNAALAGVSAEVIRSDVLQGVEGPFDLVVANPPYLRDETGRAYREGGGELGEGLSARITAEALARLEPGGTLVLYTGAAIVEGRDVVRSALEPILQQAGAEFTYEELDPDVFGEELEKPFYQSVERIAVVALVATLPGSRS